MWLDKKHSRSNFPGLSQLMCPGLTCLCGPKGRVTQSSEGWGYGSPTYTEEEALVFLDGPQAAEEARHHDNGAYGDD